MTQENKEARTYSCPYCHRLIGELTEQGLVVNAGALVVLSVVTFRCNDCKRLVKYRPARRTNGY